MKLINKEEEHYLTKSERKNIHIERFLFEDDTHFYKVIQFTDDVHFETNVTFDTFEKRNSGLFSSAKPGRITKEQELKMFAAFLKEKENQ